MERATRAPDDFHLRVVVDRLAREGCSQREIEAVVGRLAPPAAPDATAVAAGGRPPARVRVGRRGPHVRPPAPHPRSYVAIGPSRTTRRQPARRRASSARRGHEAPKNPLCA